MDAWVTPWRPLEDGQILDAGYGEFMVTPTTAEWLLDGGMTHVNGAPVRLWIVDRFPDSNCVLIRWRPAEELEDIAAAGSTGELSSRTTR